MNVSIRLPKQERYWESIFETSARGTTWLDWIKRVVSQTMEKLKRKGIVGDL